MKYESNVEYKKKINENVCMPSTMLAEFLAEKTSRAFASSDFFIYGAAQHDRVYHGSAKLNCEFFFFSFITFFLHNK